MRTFLLALPLAALVMLAGCEQSDSQSSSGMTSQGGSGATAAAPASQAQQPAPPPPAMTRHSTTQPLPGGSVYLHEQDLTGGHLTTGSAPGAPAPRPPANGGNI